jgi:outer membrane protein assembly factor BamB
MADESPRSTRRALLRATAALSAGVGLAGCSESGGTPTPDLGTPAPIPGTPTDRAADPPTDLPGDGDLLGPWPTARGDPRNHGRSARLGPEVDPTAHWRTTVGLLTAVRAAVGPDGPVVLREDGLLRAFDPDGTGRWETDHDDRFVAAPVVADDGAVVTASLDGTVRCLAPDGTGRWSVETPGRLFAPHSNDATPLRVAGDTVLVAHPRGRVSALALADGSERWSAETFRRLHRPAVADGTVLLTGDERDRDGGVTLALSLADGTERWRRTEAAPVHIAPGVHDGSVVTADIDGGVVARETDGGRERWRVTLPDEPWVSTIPQYVGGRVWVGTLGEGLFALDGGDSVERFDMAVGATPAVGDDSLYVAGGRGGITGRYRSEVVALDTDGGERWRRTVRGPAEGHLRYRDGRVTFGTGTGVVESFDRGGDRAFRSFARRETLPEPVVGPRGVYCGEFLSYVGGYTVRNGAGHLWGQGFDASAPGTLAVTDRGVLSGSRGGGLALTPRIPEEVAEPPDSRLTVTPTPDPYATPTPHVDYPRPEPRWQRELDGPVGAVGYGYRRAFVGVGTRVVSLSPDGETLWRTDLGEPVRAVPAVDTAIHASTTDGSLVALNRDDGSERWATRVGESATAPVLVDRGGSVLVGSDSGLVSVGETGTIQWRVGNERVHGPPALGGTAVFADASGVVRSVSLAGEVNWRADLEAPVHGAPALGPERVYVGARDGSVYALSKRDGSPAWRYDVGEWVDGSPVLAHGAVFVVDAAGGLTCIVGE